MAKFDGLRASTIGIHFLVSTLFGFWFGSWLDGWFGTEKLFSVIGAFLGIAAGFLNLFREVAILNRADEAERLAREKAFEGNGDRADHNPTDVVGDDSTNSGDRRDRS